MHCPFDSHPRPLARTLACHARPARHPCCPHPKTRAGAAAGQLRNLYLRKDATYSASFQIDVDSQDFPVIPKSFLGISHEWPNVEDMPRQPKYMELMKWLSSFGSGPLVVRIGGGSTDKQNFVPQRQVRGMGICHECLTRAARPWKAL